MYLLRSSASSCSARSAVAEGDVGESGPGVEFWVLVGAVSVNLRRFSGGSGGTSSAGDFRLRGAAMVRNAIACLS